jgi:hypothetical protein
MSKVMVMLSPVIGSVFYDMYISNSTVFKHKSIQWYSKPPTCFSPLGHLNKRRAQVKVGLRLERRYRLVDQWDTCFNQQGDYV